MSKWFEVKVTTVTIVLVECSDTTIIISSEEEAKEEALSAVSMTGNSEAEAQPIEHQFVAGCKHHADIVRTLDGMDDKG